MNDKYHTHPNHPGLRSINNDANALFENNPNCPEDDNTPCPNHNNDLGMVVGGGRWNHNIDDETMCKKKMIVMEKPCCMENVSLPLNVSSLRSAPEAELERSRSQYPAMVCNHPPTQDSTPPQPLSEEGGMGSATTKLTESCHEVHAGQNQRLNRGKDFQGKASCINTSSPDIRLHHHQMMPIDHNNKHQQYSISTLERKGVRSMTNHFNDIDINAQTLDTFAHQEHLLTQCACCNISVQNTISPMNFARMNTKHEIISRSNQGLNTKDHIEFHKDKMVVSCADDMLINNVMNGTCDSDAACAHLNSKQSNSSTDSGFIESGSSDLYPHQYNMTNGQCIDDVMVDNDHYLCPGSSQLLHLQNVMTTQSFCCNFTASASGGKVFAGGAQNCCIFPLNQLTKHSTPTQQQQQQQFELQSSGLFCKHGCGEIINTHHDEVGQQQINNRINGSVHANIDHSNQFAHCHAEEDLQQQQQHLVQQQIGSCCGGEGEGGVATAGGIHKLHATKSVERTNDHCEDSSMQFSQQQHLINQQQQHLECVGMQRDSSLASASPYCHKNQIDISGGRNHSSAGTDLDHIEEGCPESIEYRGDTRDIEENGHGHGKESYDSDSSSEEEIGHIIGKKFRYFLMRIKK
jgi:hypothetical protein